MAHVQRRTWAFVISGCAIVVGCAAVAGIEETTTIAPEAIDAALDVSVDAANDTTDENEPEDPADPAVDASSICKDAQARVRAVKAYVLPTNNGVVCEGNFGIASVLDPGEGGVTLATDRSKLPTSWTKPDGKPMTVNGCIALEFDAGLSEVLVRAKMANDSCAGGCIDKYCNTYRAVGMWRRHPDGGMELLARPEIGGAGDPFSEVYASIADGSVVDNPVIAVCRCGLDGKRDDVFVDYVAGCR